MIADLKNRYDGSSPAHLADIVSTLDIVAVEMFQNEQAVTYNRLCVYLAYCLSIKEECERKGLFVESTLLADICIKNIKQFSQSEDLLNNI